MIIPSIFALQYKLNFLLGELDFVLQHRCLIVIVLITFTPFKFFCFKTEIINLEHFTRFYLFTHRTKAL